MSTLIMAKCWPLQGMNASQKAVLISLADNANDDGVCWPSVAYISERTCLSERAVQSAIKFLQEVGLLVVADRNGRSNVYTVSAENYTANPRKSSTPAESAPPQKPSKPPQDLHPTPAESAEAPANAAPITTNNHQGTVNEPSLAPASPVKCHSVANLVQLGVDAQTAKEFLDLRKRKRAPLTPLALAGIQREAEAAGWDLNDVLRKCVERGWQGFEADWVKRETVRHGGFAKQNYHAGVGADGSF